MAKTIKSINIAYYKKDTHFLLRKSEFLYIIIKGEVGEYHEDELIKVYGTSNSFDADALIYGKSEGSFIVLEELICYELKRGFFKRTWIAMPRLKPILFRIWQTKFNLQNKKSTPQSFQVL